MGCRSSAPLNVVERPRDEDFGLFGGTNNPERNHGLQVVTLADLAAFEDRLFFTGSNSRRGRRARTHEERMADIAALQHGLSMMENLFENLLVGQSNFFTEAMDPNNNLQGGPPPASDAAIASLVTFPITEKELSLLHNKTCIVCCEVLECSEVVKRLPCGHLYHPNCVEPWLKRHCTCPTCRYELPTDDADFEEGRLERMKTRKLPASSSHPSGTEEAEDDSSSDDSSSESDDTHPGITWDETSSASSEYARMPGLDWDQLVFEDFMEPYADTLARARANGVSSRNDTSWMIRLIDEDTEDRPTSSLPAAVERLNSSGNVRDESPDEEGEPTPKHSNESQNLNRFHIEDEEMIAANYEEVCVNQNDA